MRLEKFLFQFSEVFYKIDTISSLNLRDIFCEVIWAWHFLYKKALKYRLNFKIGF